MLPTWLTGLLRRTRVESEMSEELRFHMESRALDLERSGLPPAEAKRCARVEFGSVEKYKETCREASGFRLFDELRADIRYAFRTLGHSLGFTTMTVLSLALGIGVNLSMFISLYYVVLHPLPYPQLDRIMSVAETRVKSPAERDAVAPADYLDWKQANRSFASLGAFQDWDVNLTGNGRPDHIQAALASAEFFHALGMAPLRGRTFTAAECEPGKDNVVVVSSGFWQSRLGARSDAIGETLSLGGRKYTVIGIMPDEFNLPLSSELWAPLAFTPEDRNRRDAQTLAVLGKLKPGVSEPQAAADLDTLSRDLERRYPRTNEERRAQVLSLGDSMKTESHRFVLVLTGAALFVLLLACSNVGSLQVARTMSREREFGLRSALGANLFRVLRQILTETLVLGLAGGAIGLALASWHMNITRSTVPPMVYRYVPGLRDMRINGETFVLALVLALVASVLCSAPAILQVARQQRSADVNSVLKEGGRSAGSRPARSRLRAVLVVGEVAMAFVLLTGAGLMVATFQRMLTVNLGYDPTHVMSGEIALDASAYREPARITNFYESVLRSLNRLPGAEGTALRGELSPAVAVSIEGRPESRPGDLKPAIQTTSPRYLDAMRIPLRSGRWISDRDGPETQRVVVLSASVARQYWPGGNPLGQRIRLGDAAAPWLTVVGVVGDVNDWFLGKPMPAAYVSYRQFPRPAMQIVARSPQDSRTLAGSLRAEVQSIDREQPIYNVHTLEQQLYEETSGVRNAARMMIIYAVIALLLAVTGIYSITSFFVAQRTREIGVRMSLGATRPAILRMVMSQSCAMSGIGLLIGLPLALLLAAGMSYALYNVVMVQPVVFAGVMGLLGALAALAGYVPAWRAARIDPMRALRQE